MAHLQLDTIVGSVYHLRDTIALRELSHEEHPNGDLKEVDKDIVQIKDTLISRLNMWVEESTQN